MSEDTPKLVRDQVGAAEIYMADLTRVSLVYIRALFQEILT